MHLLVSLEHRFDRTPDNLVWTQTMFAYSFWTRYLDVFDRIRVLARVRDVAAIPAEWQPANGGRVSFVPIPYYLGPWQYLRRALAIRRSAQQALYPHEAVILRVPSMIAVPIATSLRRTKHPFGVEVLGDPYDVFAPGAVDHPLRPFFRWWFPREMRRQCADAQVVTYVTERTLQRRYPTSPGAISISCSDVELPNEAFVPVPRSPRRDGGCFTLTTVGSLAQMYKGPDVLIDAVAALVRDGLDLRLVLVGDGRFRPVLEARAHAAGLAERVVFRGQLSAGAAVREQLDQSDIFVLPSRTEGLPRAMIEAMARGLPCIGSHVGGIPELLEVDDMVPPGDANALARLIRASVTDPKRMARMSAQNLKRARAYHDDTLRARRLAFYRAVRDRTREWLETRG